MGVSNAFTLYGILLPNGSWINELRDLTPAANLAHLVGKAAGGTVPDFRGGFGAVPDIGFSTPQIKTILDACGFWGYGMSAGNCDLFYRAGTNLAGPATLASSAHLRIRCVRALLYWTGISARQGSSAEITCRILPTFDGTNAPMVPLDDQAISGCSLAQEYFTLGPLSVNGSPLAGIEGWSLALNPRMRTLASAGEAYVSWCGIEDHDPVITADSTEIETFDTIGLDGTPLSALVAYLRRNKPDETGTYADGDAQHIKLTGSSGLITPEQISGVDAMVSLRIGLRRSDCSASHVLTASTASAIT